MTLTWNTSTKRFEPSTTRSERSTKSDQRTASSMDVLVVEHTVSIWEEMKESATTVSFAEQTLKTGSTEVCDGQISRYTLIRRT